MGSWVIIEQKNIQTNRDYSFINIAAVVFVKANYFGKNINFIYFLHKILPDSR